MASTMTGGSAAESPRVVAFINQKGGVGKTTSTASIGHALAMAGRRVCLVDLDPQAHLTLHFGQDADQLSRTVYDLLVDPACTVEEVLRRDVRPNLDLVPAVVDLAAAETELATRPDRTRILSDRFAPIRDRFDVILLDCPPSLGLLTLNALVLATEIFVPMQAHFLALQGVGKLLETVGMVSTSVNPRLRVTGIILCMHDGQTSLAREIVADLDAFFHQAREQSVPWSTCRVLRPPVRRNIKLAEAPSFGGSIFDYAPGCPGASDYRALAAQLLKDWGMQPLAIRAGETAEPDPRRRAAAEIEIVPSADGHMISNGPAAAVNA